MADVDLNVVAGRVADAMGNGVDAADALGAVTAADAYVRDQTNNTALPDDELTVHGLVGLSVRILRDTDAVNGQPSAGAGYDAAFTPENLYRHWRHYFVHIERGTGIA